MHWTLADTRDLDLDEYDELVLWLNEEAKTASSTGSIDMDAVVNAQIEAQKQQEQEDDE